MDSGDKFHLAIATILFVGLFSFNMLPTPIDQLGEVFQGFGFFVYEVAKFTGTVTNEGMCVLADMWNMGGLIAEYTPADGGPRQNETCALASENKLAITPKDARNYGDELGGIIEKVFIENKQNLLKLFYISYFLLGLVLAATIADMWMSTMGRRSTGMAIGLTTMLTIGVVMTLFRAGLAWPYLEAFMKLTPGNTMLGDAIFMMLSLSIVWFIFAQVMMGYKVAQKSYRRFSAVGKAAELDLRRGEKVLDAAEGKLK